MEYSFVFQSTCPCKEVTLGSYSNPLGTCFCGPLHCMARAVHHTILWPYFYKFSCYLYCKDILKKLDGMVQVKKQVYGLYMVFCADISKLNRF